MTPEDVMEIANQTIMTLLWMILPIMVVALVAGLLVALFQALTSIQEMTLTFVPKIVLVFLVLLATLPWMSGQISLMTINIFDKIIAIGGS